MPLAVTARLSLLHGRLLALLLGVLATAGPVNAAQPYSEDAVKAAFIYRFTGFMEWPPDALQAQQFTIAVLGSEPVARQLSKVLAQRPVKGLPARVVTVASAQQARGAQLLYVGPEYAGDLRAVVEAVGPRPVLVVTDHPAGLDDGSAVNFVRVDRKVRFEVSLPAAKRAGIKVSPGLLSVAAQVRGHQLRTGVRCLPYGANPVSLQSCTVRMAHL
jgi:hypothetical protein